MIKRPIILTIILIASIVLAIIVWYQSALGFRSRNQAPEAVTITSGEKTTAIIDDLKAKKLIRSKLAFKIYLYKHKKIKLQAGEYMFVPSTSTRQIIMMISSGQISGREIKILFREGLTAKEMQAELTKQGYLTDNSFLKIAETPIKNLPSTIRSFSFLKTAPPTATLEGYLFPDTYRLFNDFTAEDLISKMLRNFESKVTPEVNNIKDHSLFEVVTMASLLEKEVRTEADMKIVSGIFWDRIKIGQALQSCASLAYILGVNKPQYTYEDTQIDSLYNTYRHPGLTPGPISNPGLRAIRAALYPTKTEYNYFLSRPDTGETVFSKTLEEHNVAKAQYL